MVTELKIMTFKSEDSKQNVVYSDWLPKTESYEDKKLEKNIQESIKSGQVF